LEITAYLFNISFNNGLITALVDGHKNHAAMSLESVINLCFNWNSNKALTVAVLFIQSIDQV
jgi:hypothetical protein